VGPRWSCPAGTFRLCKGCSCKCVRRPIDPIQKEPWPVIEDPLKKDPRPAGPRPKNTGPASQTRPR
jgi:hypothetical protein